MAEASVSPDSPKNIEVVPIEPPPAESRRQRHAVFAGDGERRNRYHLPQSLESSSPVGYRTRPKLSQQEAAEALKLLTMERPTGFDARASWSIEEQELFEECSLGILVTRQSTNYRGHREVILGPDVSARLNALLKDLKGLEAPILDGAAYTHVVFSRPYRTPFTMLLTLVGHKPFSNLLSVPKRIWQKRVQHTHDIPTIGFLRHLHLGILADAMERATVVASGDRRRAQVFMAPFCGIFRKKNQARLRKIETLCGLKPTERANDWQVSIVAQVGATLEQERIGISKETCRKLGAALVSLRSERIQPGVNQEPKAPAAYQERQPMDVPENLTVMCGRAAFHAFSHWTGCDRERAKQLVLLERIDVLTPGGKERLRGIRRKLEAITERVVKEIPLWADLLTGRAFSRNALRGKKAFALAGQRIYVGGLSRPEIETEGLDWELSLKAFGALASRSALVAELMGCVDLPEDCDLLAGICLMAGPVNQDDIGKSHYGLDDLLLSAFPDRKPTSLLVWTLKAKTVADPIGNEEQLLNEKRQGKLVDLRPGPHEVVKVELNGDLLPMRKKDTVINQERAFADIGNFVTAPNGEEIPGNGGTAWPENERSVILWSSAVD
jgi:hypothetical protein